MKVKIGDKIVDANDEPIMLIFEDAAERLTVSDQIRNMALGCLKYCMFNDEMFEDDVKKFMKT